MSIMGAARGVSTGTVYEVDYMGGVAVQLFVDGTSSVMQWPDMVHCPQVPPSCRQQDLGAHRGINLLQFQVLLLFLGQ